MKELIYIMIQQVKKPFQHLPDDFPTPTLPPGTAGFLYGHLTGVVAGVTAAVTVAVLLHISRTVAARRPAPNGAA